MEKIKNILSVLKSSKAVSFAVLIVIVAAVPLTVFIAQQQQEIRQRASESRGESAIELLRNYSKKKVSPKGLYVIYVPIDEDNKYNYKKEELEKLFQSPATSGVTLRIKWKHLEETEGNIDFTIIDEAVSLAQKYNKTVQLILLPGFATPNWVLSKITLCDKYLDMNPLPATGTVNCGKARFQVPYGSSAILPLPLPWNETYLSHWKSFLQRVAQRYNSNSRVVSIAVTGPTSLSAEMTLPMGYSKDITQGEQGKWLKLLELFYPEGDPHRNSNLFIVEAWQKMIDFYGQIFTNKALIVTEGNGFIRFNETSYLEGKRQIYAYLKSANTGTNTKSLQSSRLESCLSVDNDAFVDIKGYTTQGLLGGIQFGISATRNVVKMGCTEAASCSNSVNYCTQNPSSGCCKLTPLDAVKNASWMYFDNTVMGDKYCNTQGICGRKSDAKLNFVQVYSEDILDAFDKVNYPGIEEFYIQVNNDILQMSGDVNVALPLSTSPTITIAVTPTAVQTTPTLASTPTNTPVFTPSPISSACNPCSVDYSSDGYVELRDYSLLMGCYQTQSLKVNGYSCESADINRDGTIDYSEYQSGYQCWQQNNGKKCIK